MIDINNIPNHPTYYQLKLSELKKQCMDDLRRLVSKYFNGHYEYKKGDEPIKIRSLLGTPCIQELIIDGEEIKYSYLFWNGKELKPDNSSSLYNILDDEVFHIYNVLYDILFNNEQANPTE